MKRSIIAVLIATRAFSAQTCCEDSSPIWPDFGLPDCFPGGYNAPAATEILCGWDLFATASFIYWHVSQDYMDAGRTAAYSATGAVPAAKAVTEYPDFSYKPGFKVGLGMNSNFDDWYGFARYTWLHEEVSHSTGALPSSMAGGARVWIPNDWFNTLSVLSQSQAAVLSTDWKFHMDMLDVGLSRPFYEGQYFTVRPNVALRTLWIRQLYQIEAYNALALTAPPAYSLNRSQSWSIGPNIGADAHWLVWRGFHFKGSLDFSLLYTRYTTLSHKEFDSTFTSAASAPISGSLAEYGCLRSITELGAGMGWGTYLYNQRYHVNFSAQYDFALFWSQNLMRQTVASLQDNPFGYTDPAGDLHMHGLTLDARFDF